MNRMVLLILLALTLLAFNSANAKLLGPNLGYGIEIGGARGDNSGGNEEWKPQIHAMIQTKLAPILFTQFGVGYTELHAKGVYQTQTLMADCRLLLSPIRMKSAFPYFYAGFGVTKDQETSGTSFLPMIPAGIGVQSPMSDNLLLQVSAGYNLVLSDELDGRVRGDNDLNGFTNQKQDCFYTFGSP